MDTRLLGERVRVLREQRGLTLRELARQVGLSASYLSRLEDGFTQPKLADLQKVAIGLGASIGELAGLGEDNSGEIEKRLNAEPRLKQHISVIAEGYEWCDENQRAIVDSLLSAIVRVVGKKEKSNVPSGTPASLTERQSHLNDKSRKGSNLLAAIAHRRRMSHSLSVSHCLN